ncbi:hypothetical protein C3R44_23090, partial [Mycobacterium tuberculosis]
PPVSVLAPAPPPVPGSPLPVGLAPPGVAVPPVPGVVSVPPSLAAPVSVLPGAPARSVCSAALCSSAAGA